MTKIVLALFVVAATCLIESPAFAAGDEVTLALDWIVNGTHAGCFVAQDKGYYTANHLAVTIVRGYGSGDTIKRLASGPAMPRDDRYALEDSR